jgi:starch phosphorylase
MLLADPERLHRILTNPLSPVQLVIAGKAHPKDETGKTIIRQWNAFIDSRPELAERVVFLADYDMFIAEQMVQGVDLWINTPRRPWEACGTSGMKVLVNGGLNLSELDGWWAEAYDPEVGWALGDGLEHTEPEWDAVEAEHLYTLLEQQIGPEFYARDAQGIPTHWVDRMRASMAHLTPRFSMNRMLRDYVEQIYVPTTAWFRDRTADAARLGRNSILVNCRSNATRSAGISGCQSTSACWIPLLSVSNSTPMRGRGKTWSRRRWCAASHSRER